MVWCGGVLCSLVGRVAVACCALSLSLSLIGGMVVLCSLSLIDGVMWWCVVLSRWWCGVVACCALALSLVVWWLVALSLSLHWWCGSVLRHPLIGGGPVVCCGMVWPLNLSQRCVITITKRCDEMTRHPPYQ